MRTETDIEFGSAETADNLGDPIELNYSIALSPP